MDVRNLIFPMTAGDLVESAQVLCMIQRGDGPDMRLCNVVGVESMPQSTEPMLRIILEDTATSEQLITVLKQDTPLLVTGISRS